jgi:hypothetical protein
MQLAMVELDHRWPDLWMFGMTHDELQMYVPEDQVNEWAVRVKEVVENLPFERFGWRPRVKLKVDLESSTTTLAQCKKLKLS